MRALILAWVLDFFIDVHASHGATWSYQGAATSEAKMALALMLLNCVSPGSHIQAGTQQNPSSLNFCDSSRYQSIRVRHLPPAAQAEKLPTASLLHKTLKGMKKAPSISVEVLGGRYEPLALKRLSEKLRKLQYRTIWTDSVDILATVSKEQLTARGDYPGPCPVIFNGDARDAGAAAIAGASAVVLDVSELDAAAHFDGEIIWRIYNADEALAVINGGHGYVFVLAEGVSFDKVTGMLPKEALLIPSSQSMQPGNAEIAESKSLANAGCRALLIKSACVGDDEDLEYATFAISRMTSKASSTFAIGGLTGSANGHFGAGKFRLEEQEQTWKRNAV